MTTDFDAPLRTQTIITDKVYFRRMPFQSTQETTEDVDNGHSKECRAFDVDLQRQHFQQFKIRFRAMYALIPKTIGNRKRDCA